MSDLELSDKYREFISPTRLTPTSKKRALTEKEMPAPIETEITIQDISRRINLIRRYLEALLRKNGLEKIIE